MTFRIKDVLAVNSSVIIGLLVLLTFQSISSSFIENEVYDFNKKWRDLMMEDNVNYELQQNCNLLNKDRNAYEDWFVEFHGTYNEDGSFSPYYDYLSKEMENQIKNKCTELVIQGLETHQKLLEVSYDGYGLNYLQQYDDEGNVYSYENGDEWDPTRYSEESDYFRTIVTGPFYVNVANLIMLIPFTISAIIASCNVFRKNVETNKASRWSVGFMAGGFGALFVGLAIILMGFYDVYLPFLNHFSQ